MTALESTKEGMFKNKNPISENKQIEVGHKKKNQESMLRTSSKKREKIEKKIKKEEIWTILCPLVSLVKPHVGRNVIKIIESPR